MSGNSSRGRVVRSRRSPPIKMVSFLCLVPCFVVALIPPHRHLPHPLKHRTLVSQLPRTQQTRAGLYPKKKEERTNAEKVRATTLAVDSSSSQQTQSPTPLSAAKNPKLKILKDKMWLRETKEDLTAAEFACSLEATPDDSDDDEKRKKKRKRAIDYEKLLTKLEQAALDLCCDTMEDCPLSVEDGESLAPSLNGKGSIVCTEEERKKLLEKILTTRHALTEIMQGHFLDLNDDDDRSPFNIQLPEIQLDIPKEDGSIGTDLGEDSLLYVRDDGTVDWDGALQDRVALKKFGIAVWARINGEDPDLVDEENVGKSRGGFEEKPRVVAKIEETEAIRMEKKRLDELMEEYDDMKVKHLALLNSAINAGQAVANINLATLDPKLRTKIRISTETLEKKEEEVSFQTLMYELERIFTYLDGEMSLKGSIPLQDRLNVAEFGLLESQIESLNSQMEAGEIVDPDVLAVVLDQLRDFKRRLGIDYFVTGLTFDRQAIMKWLGELGTKAKDGLAFYVKGCRLFWNDIVFGLSLVGRALRGYTLKPREVRNLRRTVKDIVTFVPVVIILLIPLSPVGHVFVFGAIQRFFPGFFPSCFTESRQNLLQLYESTEYSEVIINESWGEKVSRFFEAFIFLVANAVRKVYTRLRYGPSGTDHTDSVSASSSDAQDQQ